MGSDARDSRARLARAAICAALFVAPSVAAAPAPGAPVAPPPAREDGRPAPMIVSPRILYSPNPVVPDGVPVPTGRVVVKVVVRADGTVGDVELVESLGEPFDALAIAAAQASIFTPAAKDGEFISARVLHKFEFAPKGSAEAASPATSVIESEEATVGELSGRVRLEGSKKIAVPGIAITAVDASGGSRKVVSAEDGSWRLGNLAPGAYQVTIAGEGFEGFTVEETIAAGQGLEVVYRIAPIEEGVKIDVVGERPPREVTRRTVTRREMQKIPGSGGDALRAIQSLPGVARPPGLAGLLLVRGAAPQDTLTFIDGSYVPLIYHFGGLSSVVPTELLDRIDFYPGNFSAKYGRAMGGIVDVGLRSPNTECIDEYGAVLPANQQTKNCYHAALEADFINARAVVQGPIGKGWSFAAAGRRSYVDTWAGPLLQELGSDVTTAPVYYDWQLIAHNELSSKSELSVRFYGSDDRFEITTKDTFAGEPGVGGGNIRLHTSFARIQALYEAELSPAVNLRSMVSVGRDQAEFGIGQIVFDLQALPLDLRSEMSFQIFSEARLNVGMDFRGSPYDILINSPEPPRPGEPAVLFTTRPLLQRDDSGVAFRPGWYAEAEIKPIPRLLVVPGLRLDYSRDSLQADLAPRISARYDIRGGSSEAALADGTKRRRTTVKGGAGVFYQPPQFQETAPVFGTPGLASNRAIHYSLGVEQELTDQIQVSVEGFYKDLSNLVSRGAPEKQFTYANLGTGSVIGAETLLKYKPDERFFGWLAYTLSRSVRQEGPGEDQYLSQFDQTHILTLLGSYRLGDGWEVGARFRIVSGSLTTPVLDGVGPSAVFSSDGSAYVPQEAAPFSERLPLFHQLDVRIEKGWQFRLWRLSAYLDVWNSYNNPALEDVSYNFDFSRRVYVPGLPFIPSFGLRGEF